MNATLKYAWKEIKRRKRRTFGIVLSFTIIAFIIVFVSTLARLTRDTTQSVLWDIGSHSVAYIPRLTVEGCCIQSYTTDRYDPDREGFLINNAPTNIIKPEQIDRIRRSPYVKDAAPFLMFRIKASTGTGEWVLGGLDLSRPVAYSSTVVAQKQLVEGNFLLEGDRHSIMVEKEFAAVHQLKPGSALTLGDSVYNVAAIVNPPLRPGKANIYMSLSDLRELVDTKLDEPINDPINAVLVESKGAKYHEKANADISRILGTNSRISSFGCYRPGTFSLGINWNTARAITLLVILSMFFLAVKIHFSSVVERRYDIGVLKAIGWRDQNVISQVMTESVLYSIAGGLIGITLALPALAWLPSSLTGGKDPMPGWWFIIAGILLPVAGGLLAGIISSGKAVRMNPAEILRVL
jgi:putative ABC transport system permease protein